MAQRRSSFSSQVNSTGSILLNKDLLKGKKTSSKSSEIHLFIIPFYEIQNSCLYITLTQDRYFSVE